MSFSKTGYFLPLLLSVVFIAVITAPVQGSEVATRWQPGLNFEASDGSFGLEVSGKIQPRYEYERRDEKENLSSFDIKRAEVVLGGYFLNEDLTWELGYDFGASAGQDLWIDYRFSKLLAIKFGQYDSPWGWERSTSSSSHLFTERSAASSKFEWPGGGDVGMQFHGKFKGINYAAGVFDGGGTLDKETEASQGNMYSARLEYSSGQGKAKEEALVTRSNRPQFSLGGGVYHANRNSIQNWALSGTSDTAEKVTSYTANLSFRYSLYSLHLQGFSWSVDLEDGDDFRGRGYTAGGGMLLRPEKLFASARFSYSHPDNDNRDLKERETYLGLQWYHKGHSWKTHFEAGREEEYDTGDNSWEENDIFRVQHHVSF
ncbi:MAG: porin [bacterium]